MCTFISKSVLLTPVSTGVNVKLSVVGSADVRKLNICPLDALGSVP
ncbi:hypothetical protein [Candidatus Methylobacter oryzae]|nr:hypothetical protein [Candidatus Methylobacter oryzae]